MTSTAHHPDCRWERTTSAHCEWRDTHHYCPHSHHACNCADLPAAKAAEWTTCTLDGGMVYALHLPCRRAFIVQQEHDCRALTPRPAPLGATDEGLREAVRYLLDDGDAAEFLRLVAAQPYTPTQHGHYMQTIADRLTALRAALQAGAAS